jgi:hypothetical protein
MAQKIETKHPEGKSGVNIDKDKYDVIREAIVGRLSGIPDMSLQDLTEKIQVDIGESFDGSIPWYVTTVKLDLEARNMVERVKGASPQRLRLVKQPRKKTRKKPKAIPPDDLPEPPTEDLGPEPETGRNEQRLIAGILIGVVVGLIIGVATDNVGPWLTIGSVVGFVGGWLWSKG